MPPRSHKPAKMTLAEAVRRVTAIREEAAAILFVRNTVAEGSLHDAGGHPPPAGVTADSLELVVDLLEARLSAIAGEIYALTGEEPDYGRSIEDPND